MAGFWWRRCIIDYCAREIVMSHNIYPLTDDLFDRLGYCIIFDNLVFYYILVLHRFMHFSTATPVRALDICWLCCEIQ